MADVNLLLPFILRWEGGFVNDPDDAGGPTNRGVTFNTWKQVGYDKDGDNDIDVLDLRLLTPDDVLNCVLKPHYWDRCRADAIYSQKVANLIVDWVWASGAYGIKIPQRVLQVPVDGIVGPVTLNAINNCDPDVLFDTLYSERVDFIERICVNRAQNRKFRRGWLNRLYDLKCYSK